MTERNETKERRAAITQLKRALARCGKAGVSIFAMDDTLYATTVYDPSKDFHSQYQEASGGNSDLTETVIIGGPFVGSGGW